MGFALHGNIIATDDKGENLMKKKLILISILALFLAGCATVDIVLDNRLKVLHAAQLEFQDTLNRYVDTYWRLDVEDRKKLVDTITPLILKADAALQAWEQIVLAGLPDTGQEDAWLGAKNAFLFALKPYLVEE
jgi:hypothetical protein